MVLSPKQEIWTIWVKLLKEPSAKPLGGREVTATRRGSTELRTTNKPGVAWQLLEAFVAADESTVLDQSVDAMSALCQEGGLTFRQA
jgi:hypothetical protein